MQRLPTGPTAFASLLLPALLLLVPAGPVWAQDAGGGLSPAQAVQGAQQACPELTPYYPGTDPDWAALDALLAPLMSRCLSSSEYFALRGAAQLNSGQLRPALESLERALLLNPDNGAAQVDYALALFEEGQLFAALEINQRLLARQDLPAALQPALRQRQQAWRAQTRQTEYQLDVLAGYDNNLNGAPADEQLTLTLSGEPVPLTLNPEFQPRAGSYLNLRGGSRHRRLTPDSQHLLALDVRGRASEDTDSDIVQASARYAIIHPDADHAWQLEAGVNHLLFGGRDLFTGTDTRLTYQPPGDETCRPRFTLAVQHQHFPGQNQLDALEGKLSGGGSCVLPAFGGGGNRQRLSFEMGLINNANIRDGRLGGDREGWQVNLDWQHALFAGLFQAQLSQTRLKDSQGYSPLLAFNAERWQNRSTLLLQYRQGIEVFRRPAVLLINFYHQRQRSNLELFRTRDTSAEFGLSFRF